MTVPVAAIRARGVREHNLTGIDVDLPHGLLIAVTGVSGSGKSSLAFDTLYAEARRRYLLTDEGAAGVFAARLSPPKADLIDGLRPALAIAQARQRPSVRSTAGTITGIYNYLRLLYSKAGLPHCLNCGGTVEQESFDVVVERSLSHPAESRLVVLASLASTPDSDPEELIRHVERTGYRHLRVDGEIALLEEISADQLKGAAVEVVIDRVVLRPDTQRRVLGSLQAAAEVGSGRVVLVDQDTGDEERFSLTPSCADCGNPFPELTRSLFSFNSPQGACPNCRGTGETRAVARDRVLPLGEPSAAALSELWTRFGHKDLRRKLVLFCERLGVDAEETPLSEWPEEAARQLWEGEDRESHSRSHFEGLRNWLERIAATCEDDGEISWLEERRGDAAEPCFSCSGARLAPAALTVRIGNDSIADLTAMVVSELLPHLNTIPSSSLLDHILGYVRSGLQALLDLGLGYLSLDRRADTLSTGEFQRLNLAAALGSGLTGVMYVLDEPSIGLHPRDSGRLVHALQTLRDAGNSLIVVEHELELIRESDVVVELGPGAGRDGGRLIASCAPAKLPTGSATGCHLHKRVPIATRERTVGTAGWLELIGASGHNLDDLHVSIPLGTLCAVTGVSGSGKSSLVHGTLHPLLAAQLQGGERTPLPYRECHGIELVERVVTVDQSPLGRTPRSNAATYTGLLGPIRQLFAEVPEARMRGYRPGHFSFNAEGACGQCLGSGLDVGAGDLREITPSPCPTCGGSRFNREVLQIRYRDLAIDEVLQLSVREAQEQFAPVSEVARRLGLLAELGLGYLLLGQPASSLSGGEAQRVKLAAELGRPLQENTLYILDEPTSGLHTQDVGYLVELLQRLVDRKNTAIVVEHNLQLIAACDHVIDLGPEAGSDGGSVVACGNPKEIARESSHTGRALSAYLRVGSER
ncbi:MAG: excinuclease ABC subunit UvrA [Candidatus Latescibacterota bacterium]|nr:excinuclease ABC subunit UvrA [Candidatus Latescibacterota bacterium]